MPPMIVELNSQFLIKMVRVRDLPGTGAVAGLVVESSLGAAAVAGGSLGVAGRGGSMTMTRSGRGGLGLFKRSLAGFCGSGVTEIHKNVANYVYGKQKSHFSVSPIISH